MESKWLPLEESGRRKWLEKGMREFFTVIKMFPVLEVTVYILPITNTK